MQGRLETESTGVSYASRMIANQRGDEFAELSNRGLERKKQTFESSK